MNGWGLILGWLVISIIIGIVAGRLIDRMGGDDANR